MRSDVEVTRSADARATRTASLTERSVRSTRMLYIAVAFCYWIALYLYMPTLPTYVESKAHDLALVGAVLSMYGLWQAIIRLPIGIAADWLGWRKPFLVVGLFLTGLGAWVMGSADGVNGLMIGRAITGLAAGTWVPLVVVFSSLFPPREAVRASSMLMLFGSLGRLLAMSVTGSLNAWGGYRLAFFLAAGVAALTILLVLPAPEARRPQRRPTVYGIGRLAIRRDVLLPSLLSAVGQYANWAATFGFVPILARQLGASDIDLSLMITVNMVIGIFSNLLATAIVNRIGSQMLVYASFVLLALGVGGAAVAPSLPLIYGAQFCIGLALGAGYPVLMGLSIERVAEDERTTAMGWHQSIYAVGMFSGPALSGILAEWLGIRWMFGLTALFCLIVGLAGTRWLTTKAVVRPGAAAR